MLVQIILPDFFLFAQVGLSQAVVEKIKFDLLREMRFLPLLSAWVKHVSEPRFAFHKQLTGVAIGDTRRQFEAFHLRQIEHNVRVGDDFGSEHY
ncbi:MAG TPA: hypothetical protein VF630_14170 [Hymenobacter sp.]